MLICQHCGKDIEDNFTGKDATFCSDTCRYAHHNALKKIKRLERIIQQKLDDLALLANADNLASKTAIQAIDRIEDYFNLHMPGKDYMCNECGQLAMIKPPADEPCAYCMKTGTYRAHISKFR